MNVVRRCVWGNIVLWNTTIDYCLLLVWFPYSLLITIRTYHKNIWSLSNVPNDLIIINWRQILFSNHKNDSFNVFLKRHDPCMIIYYFLSIISLLDPYLVKCLIYCRLKTIPRNWIFVLYHSEHDSLVSVCDFIPKVILISFKCIYMMVQAFCQIFFVLTFIKFSFHA